MQPSGGRWAREILSSNAPTTEPTPARSHPAGQRLQINTLSPQHWGRGDGFDHRKQARRSSIPMYWPKRVCRLEQRDATPAMLHYWGWLNFASGPLGGAFHYYRRDRAGTIPLTRRKSASSSNTARRPWESRSNAAAILVRALDDRGVALGVGAIDRKDEDAGLAILCAKGARRGSDSQRSTHGSGSHK